MEMVSSTPIPEHKVKRNYRSERGATVIVVTAILALTIAILVFSYMIDQPFTQVAHHKAQDALDLGSNVGAINISSISNAGRIAADNARQFMSNTVPATSYGSYSDDLDGDGGNTGITTFRAAVPTLGCDASLDYWSRQIGGSEAYGSGLGGSALASFTSVFNPPAAGAPGACVDDYRNGVFLYSEFTPKQFLPLPFIPAGLNISVASASILKTQLTYVLVDTAMNLGVASENYNFLYGAINGAPVAGTHWPAVPVSDIGDNWSWPSIYGFLGTDPLTSNVIETPPNAVLEARQQFFLATCNNLFWRLYLQGVVNFLDLLASTSSTNFSTYVGLVGPDHYGLIAGYGMTPRPVIPIHPHTTTTSAPIITGHPFGPTGMPLPINDPNGQNLNGLYSTKTDAFNGFITSDTADATVSRDNIDGTWFNLNDQPKVGYGSGWNLWNLRMCAALYEQTSGQTLHPDLVYVPGEAGMDIVHHENPSELVRGGFSNWVDDAPGSGSPDININLASARMNAGESTRNLISGLAPMEQNNYNIKNIHPIPTWSVPSAPSLPNTGGPTWDPTNNDMTGYDVGDFSETLDVGATNIPFAMLWLRNLLLQARTDYNSDPSYGARRPIDSDSLNLVVFLFSPYSETTFWRRRLEGRTLQNMIDDFDAALGGYLCDSVNPINVTLVALPDDGFSLNMWVQVQPVIRAYEQIYNVVESQSGSLPSPMPVGCPAAPLNPGRITFLISDWQQRVGIVGQSQKMLSAATLYVNNFPNKVYELLKKPVYIN